MKRVFFTLPLVFGLIISLPYTTMAANVKSVPPPTGNQAAGTTIDKACATAMDKNFCAQTLKAQPGSANADLKKLAFMALTATKTYGSTLADLIEKKGDTPELGPKVEQAYTDCTDQYTDATAQTEESLVALSTNALNDVKTWMSTVLGNGNTCAEALKNAGVEPDMINKNKVFVQHCDMTLAVVNVLSQQKL